MRALNGVLLLDKPAGCTSNGVLQQIRKLYGAKKAGHTGSLDPSATGMLPICFGEATKLSAYMLNAEKTYSVTGLLGITTDTEDADGEVVTRAEVPPINEQTLRDVIASFHGEQMQRPPVYSAIRKAGVRSYKLAREGKAVELESRPINVKRIEMTAFSDESFSLELRVSKGTYIRSIVRDIGERFGCGAHVTELRRLSVSPFDGKAMHTVEAIQSAENADDFLLATDEVIVDWRRVEIDDVTAQGFQHGAKPQFGITDSGKSALKKNSPDELLTDEPLSDKLSSNELLRVYDSNEQFLGLGKIADGRLETVRLIHSGHPKNAATNNRAGSNQAR